jgi:hypothetical protein
MSGEYLVSVYRVDSVSKGKKVKLSLKEAVEVCRVLRRRGSHIL